GTFTDISKSSGIGALPAKGLGVAIWDYDHDGRPDIFVANDGMPGFLLHNLGGCKFEDLGIRSGLAYDDSGNYHSGMGIDAGDIDGSGGTSVVVTNFSEQQTSLYRETSTGIFRDVRISSGVGPPSQDTLGFATFFLDYANEGFPGIFVLNGHVQDDIAGLQPGVTYAEPPFLFHNQRDGTFVNVAPISGGPLAGKIVGRSAAWGDFDNDGKLDILVTTSGGKAELWHNVTPNTGHWIGLRLIGTKSNRDGIGAVVTARAGNRTSTIAVRSGSSYLSSSDLRAHLGLGGATSAEVTVTWPSGIVDHIASIPAGSYYNLVEGEGKVSPCLARVKPA
ncbi:MAG TPA: CRTAC1 family protein, partial [Chthonomonadales bacterium]|nr:CRTAC1 family protein [Chthonomonadales bacterium]